jgi:phage terminase large subunit-like protein
MSKAPALDIAEQRTLEQLSSAEASVLWQMTPAGVGEKLAPYAPDIRRYVRAVHLQYLSEAAANAIFGGGPRLLIVNMPPQHGKSTTLSWATPICALIHRPDANVVLLSHESRYASTWSRRVRDTIRNAADILPPELRLANSTRADEWTIAGGGGMVAAGLGGSVTGRRADVLLIDDPVSGAVDVQSKTYRDRVWTFLRENGLTRLAPDAVVIIVSTRWHEDDPVGRIHRLEDADPTYPRWHTINLPAIAESRDDPINRRRGAALWPKRYNVAWLNTQRALVGPDGWNTQYMGRPGSPTGAMWKRWFWAGNRNRYKAEAPPKIVATLISVDTNAKEGAANARTAIVVGSITAPPYRLIIRYSWAQNLGFTQIPQAILTIAGYYRTQRLKRIIIEDEVTGSAAIDTLKGSSHKWIRKMLIGRRPHGPKEYRAKQAAVWGMNGSILLPESDGGDADTGWLHEFEEELYAAPTGEYMDQVDATSQLVDEVKLLLAQGVKQRIAAGEDPALWLPPEGDDEYDESTGLYLPKPGIINPFEPAA